MPDIKLIPVDPLWVQRDGRMDIEISGGIKLRSYRHLDGGGGWMKDFFADTITKNGKKKYKHCFEWCSGFGILGFDTLGRGQCDRLTFSDYYDIAIQDCLETAQNNNLTDKVTGYVTGKIETIPDLEKWDLVIANPPHAFAPIEESKKYYPNIDESSRNNVLRVISDENMAAHKEFFINITKHLLPDADIFLYEPPATLNLILDELEFIRNCGIDLVDQYPIDSYLSDMPEHMDIKMQCGGMLMHFKEFSINVK